MIGSPQKSSSRPLPKQKTQRLPLRHPRRLLSRSHVGLGVAMLLAGAMLSGCRSSDAPSPFASIQRPHLPDAPKGFGKPIAIPKPRVSENAKAYAGRVIVSHQKANAQLQQDGEFYHDTQCNYSLIPPLDCWGEQAQQQTQE
jgi:hypothetical protein